MIEWKRFASGPCPVIVSASSIRVRASNMGFLPSLFSDEDSAIAEQDDDLVSTLEQCGFGKSEVNKALLWLDDLVDLREQDPFSRLPREKLCNGHTGDEVYALGLGAGLRLP